MASLEQLRDIERNIVMKRRINTAWEDFTVAEVLANRIFPREMQLSSEDKANFPAMGFNRQLGSLSNQQLFPTCFVILELDTPKKWKKRIKEGDQKTLACAKAQAYSFFWQFHQRPELPYYWMYLTPSACGIRFVLRTDQPVINEQHYRQVVLDYLRYLYRITNGKINPDHHDIRVHQAWFVPVFQKEFSAKEQDWNILPYQEPSSPLPEREGAIIRTLPKTEQERLDLAVKFTERKFSFKEGQRNDYLHYLACNCNRFGLLESEMAQWMVGEYELPEKEIRATVASAYRNNRGEHGQFLTEGSSL
jgi:hypothetical protein